MQADHLLLHHVLHGGVGVRAVEVAQHDLHEPLPSRHICLQHGDAFRAHAIDDLLQGGGVEVFFALEVVVKERLVYPSRLRNLLRSRPGQPVFTEFADGGLEDASTRVVGAFGLGAVWSGGDHI